jgi:uncharacterized protein (DUF302 family)
MRIVALALMVLPAFLPAALAGELVQRPGWVVLDTGQSFDGLSERLSEAIRAEKMGLVTQASASDGAAGQGITIPGNRVVGVYRNDYARRMLAASLAAGIEAPIRYYLTENRDGTATLSYRTPSAVFAPYFDEGGQPLQDLARELDGVFARIAERAVESADR